MLLHINYLYMKKYDQLWLINYFSFNSFDYFSMSPNIMVELVLQTLVYLNVYSVGLNLIYNSDATVF